MCLENLKLDAEEFAELLFFKDALIQAKAKIDREVPLAVRARLADQRQYDSKRYRVELTEYGWDQSDKFVKLFITLNGVQNYNESDVALV